MSLRKDSVLSRLAVMDSSEKRKLLPTGATPKKAEKFRKKGTSEDGRNSSLRSPLSSTSREGKCLFASSSPKGVKVSWSMFKLKELTSMLHCFKLYWSSPSLSLFAEKFEVIGEFLTHLISLLTFRLVDLCHAKKVLDRPISSPRFPQKFSESLGPEAKSELWFNSYACTMTENRLPRLLYGQVWIPQTHTGKKPLNIFISLRGKVVSDLVKS